MSPRIRATEIGHVTQEDRDIWLAGEIDGVDAKIDEVESELSSAINRVVDAVDKGRGWVIALLVAIIVALVVFPTTVLFVVVKGA